MTFDETGYESNNNNESEFSVNSANSDSNIEIDGSVVRINSLEIDNAELAQALGERTGIDQVAYFESVIKYGVETMRVMNTTATAESLKRVAESLANDFDSKKDDLIDELGGLISSMTATENTNSITNVLEKWRSDFRDSLLKEFDPERANSIIGKFDSLIEEKRRTDSSEIAKRLDFNDPNSAVNMLVERMKEALRDSIFPVNENVGKVLQQMGIDVAVGEVPVSSRGIDFEGDIFEIVDGISKSHGDIADNPGKQKLSGLMGNDEGDVTVLLNPEVTKGAASLFVYECKLRTNTVSDNAALKELDKGIENRGASAGVIILEPEARHNIDEYNFIREMTNNRAILYIDPRNIDIHAVRYSYLWARLKCLGTSAKRWLSIFRL